MQVLHQARVHAFLAMSVVKDVCARRADDRHVPDQALFVLAARLATAAVLAALEDNAITVHKLAETAWSRSERRRFIVDLLAHARAGVMGSPPSLETFIERARHADRSFARVRPEKFRLAFRAKPNLGARDLIRAVGAFDAAGSAAAEAKRIASAVRRTPEWQLPALQSWIAWLEASANVIARLSLPPDMAHDLVVAVAGAVHAGVAPVPQKIERMWDEGLGRIERIDIAAESVERALLRATPEARAAVALEFESIDSRFRVLHDQLPYPEVAFPITQRGRGRKGSVGITVGIAARANGALDIGEDQAIVVREVRTLRQRRSRRGRKG